MGNLSNSEMVEVSKYMCYALRHEPEELGGLDESGFTEISELVDAVNREKNLSKKVSQEDIEAIVEDDNEQRYVVKNNMIKATSGHSKGVKGTAEDIGEEIPELLYHASAKRNARDIIEEGLKPMSRKNVHMTDEKKKAISKGKRHSDNVVVFFIDAAEMQDNGINVKNTGGGVYVTEERIPPQYLSTNSKIVDS